MKNKPLVLILCGGQSLRLWPLSQYRSKNFLDIFGFSPLEHTIKRFLKVTPKENIYLVANQNEKKYLKKIKLIKQKNIFYEPESKNTAAAILLSLLFLDKFKSKSIIISPVDHLIEKGNNFYKAINQAVKAADEGHICTLGIKPNEPSEHFGYIQTDSKSSKGALTVKRFIEKPKLAAAKKLLKSKNCFFNSGMFIAKISTLKEEYANYYKDYKHFLNYFAKGRISALYKKIDILPFDKVIMEKTKKAKVVKGNFAWNDFGSWRTVQNISVKDSRGNVKKGKAIFCEGRNNLVYLQDSKKKVLLLGLDDVYLIDTKDHILLTSHKHIGKLKSYLKKFEQIKK